VYTTHRFSENQLRKVQ